MPAGNPMGYLDKLLNASPDQLDAWASLVAQQIAPPDMSQLDIGTAVPSPLTIPEIPTAAGTVAGAQGPTGLVPGQPQLNQQVLGSAVNQAEGAAPDDNAAQLLALAQYLQGPQAQQQLRPPNVATPRAGGGQPAQLTLQQPAIAPSPQATLAQLLGGR